MAKRINDLNKEIRKNLGRVIQKTRIEKGVSQDNLSEEVGITRTFLSLIENGRRFPSYDTLTNITSILGKDLNSLLIEANLDSYDEDFQLVHLLTKLIESKDKKKLERLVDFVKSLG